MEFGGHEACQEIACTLGCNRIKAASNCVPIVLGITIYKPLVVMAAGQSLVVAHSAGLAYRVILSFTGNSELILHGSELDCCMEQFGT